MSVLHGQVIPGISCSHDWHPQVAQDRWTGKPVRTGREECATCGATCGRDRTTGKIIDYSARDSEEQMAPWMRKAPRPDQAADELARAVEDKVTRPDLSS